MRQIAEPERAGRGEGGHRPDRRPGGAGTVGPDGPAGSTGRGGAG